MTGRTSRARRHLYQIERQLDALERRIGALEKLRVMLQQPSVVATQSASHIEVMQEV